MDRIFKTAEILKQEINCGVIMIPIVNYFELFMEKNKLIGMIEASGASYDHLMNKKSWVSYEYFKFILDKLVEITHDSKAAFIVPTKTYKPDLIYSELINASYALVFLGSPKNFYKIIFNKKTYETFQKVGDFKILQETKTSVKFTYNLFDGFSHNENNALMVAGLINYYTQLYGFPPPKIIYQILSDKDCVFDVFFEAPSKWFDLSIISGFTALIGVNVFLRIFNIIPGIFSILFFLIFFNLVFLIKYLQYKRRMKLSELFNQENSSSIMDALIKVENNYNELLKKEKIIIERNIYLTIINEVRKSIYEALYYTPVLFNITKILFEQLDFIKASYFEFNAAKEYFEPVFDLNNESSDENSVKTVNFMEHSINKDFYELKTDEDILFISGKQLEKYMPDVFSDSINKKIFSDDFDLLIIFTDIKDRYKGFYIFFIKKDRQFSDEIIRLIFNEITAQLKICYNNILNRNTIENILSSIPGFVIIFNKDDYSVNYINNMFIKSFPDVNNKYTKTDIIGRNIFDILPFSENAKDNIIKSIQELSGYPRSGTMEIMYNNFVYEYNLFTIPKFKNQEKIIGMIMNDITEAKYFQKNLIINEKLVALGKVASGIAHEINNPLYAVLASAEEISDNTGLDIETRKYADEIISHVIGVSNIIKDLSNYSKAMRKEDVYDVDINEVIRESLKLVKYSSNFLDIKVSTDLKDIPNIKTTKSEMQQVFINLFNNAIYAMNGNGMLDVRSSFENNLINITVKDSGSGIPKEAIPYIFDLFFTTKNEGEGTGQGLHIVKKILKKYDADIEVLSKVSEGSIFTVKFKIG